MRNSSSNEGRTLYARANVFLKNHSQATRAKTAGKIGWITFKIIALA
jgi:hypothetical protein